MSHWDPALGEMPDETGAIYGPESFVGYLDRIGERAADYRTAAELSIESRRQLADRLGETDTMALRLGSAPDHRGTQFCLVRVPNQLDAFFIAEDQYDSPPERHFEYSAGGRDTEELPAVTNNLLEVYRSLPSYSEMTLVNFALATGILSWALDLDSDQIGTAPTTLSSTFTFRFVPHPSYQQELVHNNGQVEIDALVPARRGGSRMLLVLEAKRGRPRQLAKHKLLYPTLVVADGTATEFDAIIPVYLRAMAADDTLHYSVYECADPTRKSDPSRLAQLDVVANRHCAVHLTNQAR